MLHVSAVPSFPLPPLNRELLLALSSKQLVHKVRNISS